MSPKASSTLLDAPIGQRVRIHHLRAHDGISTRLRELGFCNDATVRCISRSNDKLICEVWDSRVGLDLSAASAIVVTPSE